MALNPKAFTMTLTARWKKALKKKNLYYAPEGLLGSPLALNEGKSSSSRWSRLYQILFFYIALRVHVAKGLEAVPIQVRLGQRVYYLGTRTLRIGLGVQGVGFRARIFSL